MTVSNDGVLETVGDLAAAIFAQSIGGGGGAGGSPGFSGVSVGGYGGESGNGGTITVSNLGAILTEGIFAPGIFAQSVGGGGGTGGSGSGTLIITVGGQGGGSGNGGTVSVTNAAAIGTTGIFSDGILAQSVGASGGTGGGGTLSLISVGGQGGGAGDGGAVTVTNSGEIVTTGIASNGIFAQSVGGGGGVGGGAVDPTITAANLVTIGRNGKSGGAGGVVEIDNSAIVSTSNLFSAGLFAQSIGGGGGTGGGGTGALTIGGSAGAAGNGGDVAINNSVAGMIFTTGNESAGIIGQSIGGGGGAGGETYALVAFAQNGTGGGNGGLVTIDNAASIQTTGQNSSAIFAQSVGGGGGYAAAANGVIAASGGNAGGGGGGGNVLVTNTAATIQTTGANSHGIFAQSVGGGGGIVNDLKGLLDFSGTAGGTGTAGNVTVNQTGNILATGKNSFGILAQSVGSTNGNITFTVNSGLVEGGSTGFTGVSFIGGLPAPIGQGLEGGAGVGFLNGATNLLTNSGIVTSVGRLDGFAITGTTGNDAVINNGLVIGSVDLASGVNSFNNTPTGVFQAGTTVYLGPNGLLTNQALIAPGNYGRVLTTNVTGNFLQTASGVYGLDLDFDPTSDRINVTGTASVSGIVNINILNPGLAVPGSHTVTILSAAGGETHPGLSLIAVPTAVATYSLSFTPTDIDLNYAINFSPAGLTINEHSVGYAVNAIQTAHISPNFVPVATALFYQPTLASLAQTYDSLSGEGTTGAQDSAFAADDIYLQTVSRQIDFWRDGDANNPNAITLHGDVLNYTPADPEHPAFGALKDPRLDLPPPRTWRAWFAGFGGGAQLTGQYPIGSEHVNFHEVGGAAGLDYQITPDALLGITAGGGPSAFGVVNRATSGTVEAAHVATYGAVRWNDFYADGIVSYDFFNNEEQRFAVIPGTNAPLVPISTIAENLDGKFGSHSVSGRFEAGWINKFNSFNVTPFIALQFAALTENRYTETGTSGGPSVLGLNYSARNVLSLPTFLGAQFDSKLPLWNGLVLSPWLRLSWVHEFDPNRTIFPSFIAAPGFDFLIQGAQAAHDAARVGAGFELGIARELSVFANFVGEFSNRSSGYGGIGGVKIAW